jgi:outer membrane protein insertion porin family
MDIKIRMNEGKQFFVNRISFAGNTTTHDAVIRREMRVAEGAVFNTEALKESVRRLNQLGYFKPLEGGEGEMEVVPTPGTDNKVDVSLKVEEQNRNQLSFGAGVSQFEGFFGQLSFQTANFLGRGETVGISVQKGSQARQYQISFTEPYLFERPITLGMDIHSRQYVYPLQFTQEARGGNIVVGLPLADYTRLFLGYSYEQVRVFDVNEAYTTPQATEANPFLIDTLLINEGGSRNVSKVSPRVVFNTVNQPIFPTAGTRYTASVDLAGLGGNTHYVQTRFEGVWYRPFTVRTGIGVRAEAVYIRPYRTTILPIFEKIFLGGEYSIRGFDSRTISPRDPLTGTLTGGNKSVVLNAEYYVNLIGGKLRLVAFYDVGQVQDIGQPFAWKDDITALFRPPLPAIVDFLGDPYYVTAPGSIYSDVVAQTSAFKTSTGFEARFFIPVLNVPFRLIGAMNPQRFGVLNNDLEQTPKYTFRFAVGTMF